MLGMRRSSGTGNDGRPNGSGGREILSTMTSSSSSLQSNHKGTVLRHPIVVLSLVVFGAMLVLYSQYYDATLSDAEGIFTELQQTVSARANAAISSTIDYSSSVTWPSSSIQPPIRSRTSLEEVHSVAKPKLSLHQKWKLWEEMDDVQRTAALDEAGTYLTKYGKMIMKKGRRGKIDHTECPSREMFGSDGHALCGPPPPKPCFFFSFGINDDPSFDKMLADKWGCRGFAADPTVDHPSKIHPLVTFHNIGATMLSDNEERLINKGGAQEWWDTSMPSLRKFLGVDHIDILKLDCEGCEVAFARDIIREDPLFLKSVNQLSIETHVTKTWINRTSDVYYFALHFALLEEAGFEMVWSNVFGCSKRHEVTGCVPELEKYGFPCGYDPWPGHPKVVLGRSCQDFLWVRKERLSSATAATS